MNEKQTPIFRRFEAWLILIAVIVALALSCSGCAKVDAPERKPKPEPSSVLKTWSWGMSTDVIEFRDSGGRICTAIRIIGTGAAIDCDELRPMQYEDLPEEPEGK